jgi:hypothetical protein
VAFGAFITAGLMLYLGWLIHMGMDMKDYDNSAEEEDAFFLINLPKRFV